VSSVPLAHAQVADLLQRLAQAATFAEAVDLLIDLAVRPAGIERVLLLVEAEGQLAGFRARGWNAIPIADLRFDPGGDSGLAEAYRSAGPTLLSAEALEPLRPLRLTRGVAIPLARVAPAASPFALLVCDAARLGKEQIDELAELLRPLSPLLARLHELDEAQRAARLSQRQRDLLTSIVNALPDPVLITDSENNVLLENRRAETLLTTSEADSEGRRRAVEINNLLLSSFLSRSGAARDSGARELNLVDPSEGGDLLFEVISTPLPVAGSQEGAIVSVLREVTDLKRAAGELEQQFKRVRQAELKSRRERDRLNLILETVGDPILVTDDGANIILMNREAERLFEAPAGADLRDRRRQEVRTNDTKFSSIISDLALSPAVTRVVELQMADPETGREFPAEVVSGKVYNDRGELAAIVSIVHDQTKVVENERLASELARLNEGLEDRIRAATAELEDRNRQLEWQRQELERAYRLKSEFLASMSHELRTPINALLGYTSLMRDRIYGELTPRQEEALQRMYAASQHLLELVNDVLDLAKIEAGKMPVNIEPMDLGLLIREISLTIEPMVRRKKLEYRVRVDPALPPIETDRTKVKQILLNLLSNAVKFTHQGYIELSAAPAEDPRGGVEIAVKDSGIGIRPEDMDKIFEDFRQVDQSSTREYGGTGLGLSITKKLLKLLSGTVRVESFPGDGSTFTVWLPARSSDQLTEGQAARAALHADDAVLRPQTET
jgi:PAS domain S-box-containing protein